MSPVEHALYVPAGHSGAGGDKGNPYREFREIRSARELYEWPVIDQRRCRCERDPDRAGWTLSTRST